MSSANAAPVQSVSESPPSPPDDRSGSQRKEKLKRSKDGCFSVRSALLSAPGTVPDAMADT
jgi:hypothetical protein